MSSSRSPNFHARSPRFSSSFASCFGATAPISPPRTPAGHDTLSTRAYGVNYQRLGLDDFYADEGHRQLCCRRDAEDLVSQSRNMIELGKYSSFTEKRLSSSEALYDSDGEQRRYTGRERRGLWKLGKERARSEKAGKKSRMGDSNREENCENGLRQTKGTKEVYGGGSDSERGSQRQRNESKREEAMKEGECVVKDELLSPRRPSFGTRIRGACMQVLETARRSSPHLSELFVGNLLLMQVTSSSFNKTQGKHRVPSYGVHYEFAGDPPISSISMIPSPASSASSAL